MAKQRKLFTPNLILLRAADYENNPQARDIRGLEVPVKSLKGDKQALVIVPALNSTIEELYFYFWAKFASALAKSNLSVAQFVASLASRQFRTDEANNMRNVITKVIPIARQVADAIEAGDFVTAQRLLALAEAEAKASS